MEYNLKKKFKEIEDKLLVEGNSPEFTSLGIKIMCFLNIISGYRLNFDNMDYSTLESFNEGIYRNVDMIPDDGNLKDILLILVKIGAFKHGDYLNEINDEIKSLTNEQKLQLFNYSTTSNKDNTSFATEDNLIKVVLELVDLDNCENVFDITSGEGMFLTECAKRKNSLKLYGCEFNVIAYIISRMRLSLCSVNAFISESNVLRCDLENEYDLVFSDFPWRINVNETPENDKHMIVNYQKSKKNADWYFIFKAINAMKETGKAIVIAPTGALYSALDKVSRKEVVDKKLLEKVILMPSNSRQSTGVSYVIMVFSYNNEQVEFIDASDCYDEKSRLGRYRKIDQDKFRNTIHSKDSENVILVSNSQIKEKDYNLELKKYLNKINEIKLINPKKIGDFAEIIPGFQYTSNKLNELGPNQGNVSILKLTNFDDGYIDYDELNSIDIDEKKVGKYLLQENDVVLTARGSALKFAVISDLEDRMVVPHFNLMVIRVKDKTVNPVYLCNFLMSKTGRLVLETIQTGQAVTNISRRNLENMEISVVDLATQETIANRYTILKKAIYKEKKKLDSMLMDMDSIYDIEVGE